MIRNMFKYSLQITGLTIVSYHYFLKPEDQAALYGLYRSTRNSTRTSMEIFRALRQYKSLASLKSNKQQYQKQLHLVNLETAQRILKLSKQNKGVYMRMAQTLGHMRSVFPTQFSEVLSKISSEQMKNQIIEYSYIKRYLQKQLGKTTKLQFQSLNTTPIRCDLFSQTYKGQLIQSFADVLVTILHPYARAEAKYDFWFLNKAVNYCNKFQKKHFSQNQSLLLNNFLNNLQKNINQQLNIKEEEQVAKKIKNTFEQKKISSYVPHYLSQLTTNSLKIVQFVDGTTLQNKQNLIKNLFDLKALSFQIPNTFNILARQSNIIYDIYKSRDIKVRKPWPTQKIGAQIICVQNFSQRTNVQKSLIDGYQAVWNGLIQKKISKGKQKQKTSLIQTFYKSLPDVLLYQVLKSKELTKQMSQQQIDQQKINKVARFIQDKFSSQVKKSLIDKKLMQIQKKKKKGENTQFDPQTLKNYEFLLKTFEIRYQPWKFQSLYRTYVNIFENPAGFGAPSNN